jgi:CspA family cold shock protein
MQRLRGRIVWYCATKGFGFIARQNGPDVFLHQSDLHIAPPNVLKDGAEVEFEVAGPEGLQAENVALIGMTLA